MIEKPSSWLTCSSIFEWHNFLESHHLDTSFVWLEIKKKHALQPGIQLAQAVEEALCWGWIDGQMFSINETCFIIRMTPRLDKSVWSLINKNRALKLIKEKRMTPYGQRMIDHAIQNGAWEKAYTSLKNPQK